MLSPAKTIGGSGPPPQRPQCRPTSGFPSAASLGPHYSRPQFRALAPSRQLSIHAHGLLCLAGRVMPCPPPHPSLHSWNSLAKPTRHPYKCLRSCFAPLPLRSRFVRSSRWSLRSLRCGALASLSVVLHCWITSAQTVMESSCPHHVRRLQ